MARALLELRATVSDRERAAFLERARVRQAALHEIGVSFWLFEQPDVPGEMVQYVEARDPALLAQARSLVAPVPGEHEIRLHQVEL